MSARRRPTRRDLLVVVTRLQEHLSEASMYALDETSDPGNIRAALDAGMRLCFEATAQDNPVDITRGAWARTAPPLPEPGKEEA